MSYPQGQGHGQQQQQYYAPPPGQQPQQHVGYGSPPPNPQQQQHAPQQQQHIPQQQQHIQQQQHAAYAPPPPPGGPPPQTDSGAFAGGSYSITHRDTNAVLNVTLQQGATIRSKSGAMIHMSATIGLSGKIKFSMKKLFTGSEMSESTYAGPGRIALGPTLFGDIITLHVDGRQAWTIGKDAFLGCTSEVSKDTKAQGLGKTLFSGEDLFVYRVGGQGIMWLTSFGAVDRLDVSLEPR